jgi:hypothetical protein
MDSLSSVLYDRFRAGSPAGQKAYGCLLPFCSPHAVRLRIIVILEFLKDALWAAISGPADML